MNNGEKAVETLYLSPQRKPETTTLKNPLKIKDIFFECCLRLCDYGVNPVFFR